MVAPISQQAFFEQTEFERLLGDNFLQITRFTAQIFHLVSRRRADRIARQPPFPSFHEVLGPLVVNALRYAFTAAQLSNAVFAA